MTTLLDTDRFPRADRAEAVRTALLEAGVPARGEHEDAAGGVRMRVDHWRFGAGALLRSVGTGMRLRRPPALVRRAAPESVAVSVQLGGRASLDNVGHTREMAAGDLHLTDLTAAYDYRWRGHGGALAFNVGHRELGLPVDVVRRAAPRLPGSPLYALMGRTLLHLAGEADRIERDPRAAAAVGTATTELMRALFTTAAADPDEPGHRDGLAASLPTRLTDYARRHLTDPDLTAGRIARAHGISLRHLYTVWPGDLPTPGEWIVRRRLRLAAERLASPAYDGHGIERIARECGFVSAAHFSRRFRQAHGMTPREWRRTRGERHSPSA
jgi:AraC-like DNA-binding protein